MMNIKTHPDAQCKTNVYQRIHDYAELMTLLDLAALLYVFTCCRLSEHRRNCDHARCDALEISQCLPPLQHTYFVFNFYCPGMCHTHNAFISEHIYFPRYAFNE